MNPALSADKSTKIALEAISAVEEYLQTSFRDQALSKHHTDKNFSYDSRAERMITDILKRTGIPICGEELTPDTQSDTMWVVDPIDGTGWFMRGVPRATTMITLIENKLPVLSIVNNFETGSLMIAEKNKISANDDPGHAINAVESLGDAYVETHGDDARAADIRLKNALWEAGACVVNNAAMGYSFMQLAAGELDGIVILPSTRLNIWDYIHGTLTTLAAGGTVLRSSPLVSADDHQLTIMATNKQLAFNILQKINDHTSYSRVHDLIEL